MQNKLLTNEQRDQILREFESADAANQISFTLERAEHKPGILFSEAAIDQLVDMIKMFIGGRVLGMYNATKIEPDKVKVTITVENIEKHIRPGHHRMK